MVVSPLYLLIPLLFATGLAQLEPMACHYKFKILPEYFVDYFELAKQCPDRKVTTQPKLGLIYQSDDGTGVEGSQLNIPPRLPWEQFVSHITRLNADSPDHVMYKVLYLTRHGLGVHNIYEAEVGRGAWNNHWSHLDGNGKVIWTDARLVEAGIQQAKSLARFWADSVTKDKVPLPGTLYTSPLTRCLETTRLAFSDLITHSGRVFQPTVKELLRERLTDHTCDKRSTKTLIQLNYPSFIIEPGFSESDTLWKPDQSESTDEHVARKQTVLEDIFSSDPNQFISLTIHSYALSALLRACGSAEFRIAEGAVLAIVVRGERVDKPYLETSY